MVSPWKPLQPYLPLEAAAAPSHGRLTPPGRVSTAPRPHVVPLPAISPLFSFFVNFFLNPFIWVFIHFILHSFHFYICSHLLCLIRHLLLFLTAGSCAHRTPCCCL